MRQLMGQIRIRINPRIFLKDPESSPLGQNIVQHSILLIDQHGLEWFTFRKLAKCLGTTESSVYRYFENKHRLLIYLTSWYWGWQEYRLVFATANLESPEEQLRAAIRVLAEPMRESDLFPHIDLEALHRIIISESSKAYFTKEVDEENKEGFFAAYKRLCQRVSEMVSHINPDFKHPHTLISTVIEGIYHQQYFAAHLPTLTDFQQDKQELTRFFSDLALTTLKHS